MNFSHRPLHAEGLHGFRLRLVLLLFQHDSAFQLLVFGQNRVNIDDNRITRFELIAQESIRKLFLNLLLDQPADWPPKSCATA